MSLGDLVQLYKLFVFKKKKKGFSPYISYRISQVVPNLVGYRKRKTRIKV